MQFHILNENYIPVAVMDNDLSDAINFNNSKFHRFLTGSADFFDFETSKLHIDHSQFQVGYWLAFKYDDRDRLQYINEISEAESDKMMTISSVSSNLDLNNETKEPFSATEAKPFKWYFDIIMFDTGYEIGINEISNLTRKLSWESSMTVRAFIQSVATQFDNAELDYEVVLNSDFTIKKRLVHIKKKIGEVRDDIELRYGDNVKTVKRTTSISELCTAVRPVSKDDNDKVVDISSLNDWQELDEKGNVKFFHKKGTNLIFAPQANDRFGNRGHNVTGGGYIVHDFSYDKVSQSELFNRSHIYLKEHSVPAINYEVDGRTGAKIGDTVKIVDDGYTPPLILSARVLEQVFSFDNASVEQSTFGNYKALQSQISTDLIAKMQQLAEENAPYKAVTLTTNGLTFKNSEGSTTLTARLYKGSKEIMPESYEWTIDGVAISSNSEQYEITADDINGKAVIRWSAVINGVMVAFDEVTITDVSDGSDGSDGRGVSNVAQKWLVQSSNTVPTYAWTDSMWQTTLPVMSATDKYLYTIERMTYTDANTSDAITLSAVYGDNGVKGDDGAKGDPTGIIKSATEPSDKFANMIWYVDSDVDLESSNMDVGTTAKSHGTYTWVDSKWSLYMLRSVNMEMDNGFISNAMIADATIESAKINSLDAEKINANNLSVISADLGDVSAGTVTLMDDNFILNGPPKKYGIYQSKLGLSSSGPTFEPTGMLNDSQMGVANLNKGELRFIVTDYTENLKDLQEAGMSDPNTAFIRFNSYDNGKDVMTISSSGDIVFNGITSQNTPWITLSSGVKYKYMFSRLYVSVDVVGNGNAYMLLGKIPQNYRPISDKFMLITNWGTGTADDRHIQIRVSDGELILWSPKSGVNYNGEISYTL